LPPLPPDLAQTTILNAAGTLTRLSGARIAPGVAKAMVEAAGLSFDMWKLQAAASRRIAAATGAEAGLVTTGASAGLTLAAAAAIAGLDPVKMDALPLVSPTPEIIVPRTHRNAYDRALRVAGAALRDIGVADRETDAGVRGLEAFEVEAAIGPATVALAANGSPATAQDIPLLAGLARAHGVPLIVDAAAQLPPVEGLKTFLAAGADLVVFSGGKAIGGPQASGILAGRRDLIASAALQMLDMDTRPEAFEAPPEFFGNGPAPVLPRHGLGRGYKASKEAIVGLMAALDVFLARDAGAIERRTRRRLAAIARGLSGLRGIAAEIVPGRKAGAVSRLAIRVVPDEAGMDASDLAARLRRARPAVYLAEGRIGENVLLVDLAAIRPEDDAALVQAIAAALGS
jgi:L-seryl-tRNA(Ser) seleniumtransferase